MEEEEDNKSDCPICFETFDEAGDHIPRVLPCGGIICEKCIAELIEENSVDCPECGSEHAAENGVKSFPENTSSQSENSTAQETDTPQETEDENRCKEHGKHPSIYCKEPFCQKAILILQATHTEQDVDDAEDEQVETLFSSLESVSKLLSSVKSKIMTAKAEIEQKNKACLARLKTKQGEMTKVLPREEEIINLLRKRFEELEKGASDQMTRMNTNIDNEVTAIDEHLTMLDSIKETTHTASFTRTDIANRLETINNIKTQVQGNISDKLTLKYLEYNERPATRETLERLCTQLKEKDFCEKLSIAEDVESLCGCLRQRETCVHLTAEDMEEDDDLMIVDAQIARKAPEERPRQQDHASFSVVSTINTKYHQVSYMSPLADGTIVVCGKKSAPKANEYITWKWKLTRFNGQYSGEVCSTTLSKLPFGMTEITLGGRQCVAISYRNKKEIHFHDVDNLQAIVLEHSVAPFEPLAMCVMSPTTLTYVDCLRSIRDIRWLDCSGSIPKPGSGTNAINTQQDVIWDMCCLQEKDKQVIITTRGFDGLSAYSNVRSGRLEWNMKGELPGMEQKMYADGITTDGRGHYFVCDVTNKFIHMFSTSGYQRAIWKGTEEGLGRPLKVRWCNKSSSLNVLYMQDNQYKISKIQIHAEDAAIMHKDQIKREAEETTGEPPAKKSRWDATTREQSASKERASQFKCKVAHTIRARCSSILHVHPLSDGSIVVCGKEQAQWKLARYSMQHGREVCSTILDSKPDGLAPVKFAGRQCLALSYTSKKKINFHNVDSLKEVVCSHSVAPHQPGHISAASPTVLIYEDRSVTPRVVKWLDCSTSLVTDTNVTPTQHAIIWDLCCVTHSDKQFLVMTRANNGLFAYNTQRGQAGWTVKGKLTNMDIDMSVWGVTTDECGHLFVCDINNSCIQMFTAGGRYMGTLLKEGDQSIAQPWLIRWCKSTSSLVVVDIRNRQYNVSVIKVTVGDAPVSARPEEDRTDGDVITDVSMQQREAPTTVTPSESPAATETCSLEPTLQLKCRGTLDINTKCKFITHMSVIGGNAVVACCQRGTKWKLIRYNVRNGAELDGANLDKPPQGLEEVRMSGKHCLAMCYGSGKLIEFRDANNLKDILLPYPLSYEPGLLCASSASTSTLLSLNHSTNPPVTRWLYCSSSPTLGSYKTKIQQSQVWDMCCIQDGEKCLLVTTCGSVYGIQAYNTSKDKREWQVKGKLAGMEKEIEPAGITTDGRSQLFVVDYANSCIHMFKTNGTYLGQILKYEDNRHSGQWRIRFCSGISSLIIAHMTDNNYHIGVFKVIDGSSAESSCTDVTSIESALEYSWKVVRTKSTSCTHVSYMNLVGDNKVVVCGRENGQQWKLTQYHVHSGEELSSTDLCEMPWGTAAVTLGGRACLAVSYMDTTKIDFYDINKLSKLVRSYSVKPHIPSRLCTASSPFILLYEDVAKLPREVRWLDCSNVIPYAAADITVTKTQQSFIQAMCCVDMGEKQLLVTTEGFGGGIYAYNAGTNQLEWNIAGKLPGMKQSIKPSGITTDGQGHLFVCDSVNKCIHMFCVDREYMGAVMREEAHALDQPVGIRWSNISSSLIVVHKNESKYSISTIRDTTEDVEIPQEKRAAIAHEESASAVSETVAVTVPQEGMETVGTQDIPPEETPAEGTVEEGEIVSEDVIIIEDTPTKEKDVNFPTQVQAKSPSCYTVFAAIPTTHSQVTHMSCLGDGNIVVSNRGNEQWRLIRHNVWNGDQLYGANLAVDAGGITEVTLNGRLCLAAGFPNTKEIVFYDVKDLSTPVYSYPLAAHKPGCLCTASSSILLYVNYASYPCEVRWLDCSTMRPIPLLGSDVTHTEQGDVYDMCCLQTEGKQLLLTVHGYKGVYAYNTSKDVLEWNVKGRVPGMKKIISAQRVATDGRGCLFVCDDYNDCIQMFTLEGHYMGAVADNYLGKPWRIRWCNHSSSLTIVHVNYTKYSICKIQIDEEHVQRQLAEILQRETAEGAPDVEDVPEEDVLPGPPTEETLMNLPLGESFVDLTTQDGATGQKYRVIPVTQTEHRNISYVSPLGGNEIIVCGTEGGRCKITKYNLHTGAATDSTVLDRRPAGMAVVVLNGRQCLAVAYTNKKVIVFYDVNNSNEVVHCYSTAPHKPGRLYTASPNILLLEDRSMFPCAVKWLDCRSELPRLLRPEPVHTQQGSVDDICCAEELLIVTRVLDGIYAYNTTTDSLQWNVEGQVGNMANRIGPESIATDGQGRLFVGDFANSCVQMFSTSGEYLGHILKEMNQNSAQPIRVSWCNSMSSLLVAQVKDQQYQFSLLQNIPGDETRAQSQGHEPRGQIPNVAETYVNVQQQDAPQEGTPLVVTQHTIAEVPMAENTQLTSVEHSEIQHEDQQQETSIHLFTIESTDTQHPSVSTDSCTVSFISALPWGSVVACCKVGDQWKLIQCHLQSGAEIHSTLEEKPGGMASVTMGGRQCVAVSYRVRKQIVFNDVYDITKIILRYGVAPDEPGRLCTSSPTFLMYEDQSQKPRQLRWLECNIYPSAPRTGMNTTYTRHASLVDICGVSYRNQHLLVTARGFHGVDAYNVVSSKLEWSVIGKLPGMAKGMCAWSVTTDGRGQLYVADKSNSCIQVLFTDGQYTRTIRKPELEQFCAVRWWGGSDSLVYTLKKDGKFLISVIQSSHQQEAERRTEEPVPVEQPITTDAEKPRENLTQETEEMEMSQETVSSLELSMAEDMETSENETSETEVMVVDSPQAVTTVSTDTALDVPQRETNQDAEPASLEHYKVVPITKLEHSHMSFMCLLDEHHVMLCGVEFGGQCKLAKYRIQDFTKLDSVKLNGTPWGMAVVTLDGQPCVALSLPYKKRFDFHDADNLKEVVFSHNLDNQPRFLSTLSPTMLLYENRTTTPPQVNILDCSKSPPTSTEGINISGRTQNKIWGICCVQDGSGKELLITAQAYDGVYAYNIRTNEADWTLKGKLPGMKQEISILAMAADGRGRLFCWDSKNACVQVCSVDGNYMGAILQEESQYLAKPWRFCWCSSISSLIIVHTKEKQYHISMIRDTSLEGHAAIETQAELPTVESLDVLQEEYVSINVVNEDPAQTETIAELPAAENTETIREDHTMAETQVVATVAESIQETTHEEATETETQLMATAAESMQATLHEVETFVIQPVPENEETTRAETAAPMEKHIIPTVIVPVPDSAQIETCTDVPVLDIVGTQDEEVTQSESHVEPSASKESHITLSTSKDKQPLLEEVSDAELLCAVDRRTPEKDPTPEQTNGDTSATQGVETDTLHKGVTDVESTNTEGMDISYEEISDTDLPCAEDSSEDEDESDVSVEGALQTDDYKVETTTRTEHSWISFFTTLADNSVVICGKEDDCEGWKLTKYSLQGFTKLHSTLLEKRPYGMTEIALSTKHCVAVSYQDQKKIDFHDAGDLREIVLSHTVRHLPGSLCAGSPTILLYEDRTRVPCEVRWLNCSVSPPKPVTGKNITFTKQDMIWDMCCIKYEDKQLLVTTRGFIGIFAYNLWTDDRVWHVKGRRGGSKKREIGVESITTDGRGNLFVCDKNACIWMFSMSGNYLATVMRHRNPDVEKPWCISWCQKTSSLVIVHTKAKDKNYHITKIKEKSQETPRKDAGEKTAAAEDVEKFLADLTQNQDARSLLPMKELETGPEDLDESTTALEKLRENLLEELAHESEQDEMTSDDSVDDYAAWDDALGEEEKDAETNKTGDDGGPAELLNDDLSEVSKDATAQLEDVASGKPMDKAVTTTMTQVSDADTDVTPITADDDTAAPDSHAREVPEDDVAETRTEGTSAEKALITDSPRVMDDPTATTETNAPMSMAEDLPETVQNNVSEMPLNDKEIARDSTAKETELPMTIAEDPLGTVQHNITALADDPLSAATKVVDSSEIMAADNLTTDTPGEPKITAVHEESRTEADLGRDEPVRPDESLTNADGRTEAAAQDDVPTPVENDDNTASKTDDPTSVETTIMTNLRDNNDKTPATDGITMTEDSMAVVGDYTEPMEQSTAVTVAPESSDGVNTETVIYPTDLTSDPSINAGDVLVPRLIDDIATSLHGDATSKGDDTTTADTLEHITEIAGEDADIAMTHADNLAETAKHDRVTTEAEDALATTLASAILIEPMGTTVDDLTPVHETNEPCATTETMLKDTDVHGAMTRDTPITDDTERTENDLLPTISSTTADEAFTTDEHMATMQSSITAETDDRTDEHLATADDLATVTIVPATSMDYTSQTIADTPTRVIVTDHPSASAVDQPTETAVNLPSATTADSLESINDSSTTAATSETIDSSATTDHPSATTAVDSQETTIDSSQSATEKGQAAAAVTKDAEAEMTEEPLQTAGDDVPADTTQESSTQLQYRVTQTIGTEYKHISYICALPDDTVIVCGKLGRQWKLARYNLQDGAQISCVKLVKCSDGMTAVTLDGKSCVALSYMNARSRNAVKMEFRDVNRLSVVMHRYSVGQCQPGRICSSSPSTLIYIDHQKYPHQAEWLDCSTSLPEPAANTNPISIQHDIIWDMCFVQSESKNLLVTTGGFEGIGTYNTSDGKMEWSVKGKLSGMDEQMTAEGVATDRHGNLFVSDENNRCIHRFSMQGSLNGTVLKEGEQGLGRPRLIHWCDETSSLIVAHIIGDRYSISKIQAPDPDVHEDAAMDGAEDDAPNEGEEEDDEELHKDSTQNKEAHSKSVAGDAEMLPDESHGSPLVEAEAEEQALDADVTQTEKQVAFMEIAPEAEASRKDVTQTEIDRGSPLAEADVGIQALDEDVMQTAKQIAIVEIPEACEVAKQTEIDKGPPLVQVEASTQGLDEGVMQSTNQIVPEVETSCKDALQTEIDRGSPVVEAEPQTQALDESVIPTTTQMGASVVEIIAEAETPHKDAMQMEIDNGASREGTETEAQALDEDTTQTTKQIAVVEIVTEASCEHALQTETDRSPLAEAEARTQALDESVMQTAKQIGVSVVEIVPQAETPHKDAMQMEIDKEASLIEAETETQALDKDATQFEKQIAVVEIVPEAEALCEDAMQTETDRRSLAQALNKDVMPTTKQIGVSVVQIVPDAETPRKDTMQMEIDNGAPHAEAEPETKGLHEGVMQTTKQIAIVPEVEGSCGDVTQTETVRRSSIVVTETEAQAPDADEIQTTKQIAAVEILSEASCKHELHTDPEAQTQELAEGVMHTTKQMGVSVVEIVPEAETPHKDVTQTEVIDVSPTEEDVDLFFESLTKETVKDETTATAHESASQKETHVDKATVEKPMPEHAQETNVGEEDEQMGALQEAMTLRNKPVQLSPTYIDKLRKLRAGAKADDAIVVGSPTPQKASLSSKRKISQAVDETVTLRNKPAQLSTTTFMDKLRKTRSGATPDDAILIGSPTPEKASRRKTSQEKRKAAPKGVTVIEDSPLKKIRLDDKRTAVESVSNFHYKVAQKTINTKHCRISYMAMLTGNSVVVCSKDYDYGPWNLTKYNVEYCKEVETTTLKHIPDGLAAVTLNGKYCVVVSYMDKMQIDFHNANRLENFVLSHSVSSHRPGRLCSASTSILLYEDQSKEPREVRWLNCSTSPPKLSNPAVGAFSTHTQQDIIWDVCCVKHGDGKMVATTRGYDGVYAYNANSDKLEWHVKGKLTGMTQDICAEALTTDGCGHLFVCDRDNTCVQMFSVDGTYMGPLMREQRQSLERPLQLRWYKNKTSLVVVHPKREHYTISVIPVNVDDVSMVSADRTQEEKTQEDALPDKGTADDVMIVDTVLGKKSQLNVPEQQEAMPFKFKVVSTTSTEHDVITLMSAVAGNSVVVCGKRSEQWRLALYNLQYGGELCRTRLPSEPDGMTVVTLDGRRCLALSYTNNKKIYFHDVSNLNEIVLSHSVAPHVPGPMFTSSPTMLLYEDLSKYPLAVRWLDCSTSPPKPAAGINVTHTQQIQVWDMCFVKHEEKELLIATRGQGGGIYGYDTNSDKLEWIVKGKLPGTNKNISAEAVTTDGCGHLFVCDTSNACIQMFAVDGTYLGCAFKAGEQELGGPWRIRWCNSTSSLAVIHIKDLHHNISVVQVTSENEEAEMVVKLEETEKSCSGEVEEFAKGKNIDDEDVMFIESSPENVASLSLEATPKFDWKVGSTVSTRHKHISYISCLPDGSIVVCCNEDQQWKLIQFDVVNDEELARAILDNQPDGMTEVMFGGVSCLALSYLNDKEIDFYDTNNLHERLVSFPVAPHLPGRLCTVGGSTLLYEDESKHPHVIRWLECSASLPKPFQLNITHLKVHSGIYSMCCVQEGDRKLLVTAHGHKGVSVYNTNTDKLEWAVEGEVAGVKDVISPQGLTTDGRGHIFMCDKNNKCIQMFSITGDYMGTVLGRGRHALRKPWRICWCDKTSSLIVVHKKDKYYRISIVRNSTN